ncbi:MAG: HIT domain-containing protein [Thermoproteus sp.]
MGPFRIVITPWRYKYIVNVGSKGGCFFCDYIKRPESDRENLVFFRGEFSIGLLNRYPYMWGHVMVAPYKHVGDLEELTDEELAGLLREAYSVRKAVEATTGCSDMLMGVNVGRAAGAGVDSHLHIHIIPRCREIDPDTPQERLEAMLLQYRDELARIWS